MTVVKLVQGCQHNWVGDLVANGGFSEDPDTFHLEFDRETESVSEAIVRAVTLVKNVRPVDLPPLAHTIDPDALNALFEPREAASETIEVSFQYEEFQVTIDDGNIWLTWAN